MIWPLRPASAFFVAGVLRYLNLTAVPTRTAQQQVDEHHCGASHSKQVNLTYAHCALKGTLIRFLT
jgi:hypothetical protein